jgi:hypothetical protein
LEELITSIFRVKKSAKQETNMQQVVHIRTTQRYIPEDGNIHNCDNHKSCIMHPVDANVIAELNLHAFYM